MSTRFPGESGEYRAARDRLLKQEIELRRVMEAVAAARRELPPGADPGGLCIVRRLTAVEPRGVGLVRTTIHDPATGPDGAAAQSLLVAKR